MSACRRLSTPWCQLRGIVGVDLLPLEDPADPQASRTAMDASPQADIREVRMSAVSSRERCAVAAGPISVSLCRFSLRVRSSSLLSAHLLQIGSQT